MILVYDIRVYSSHSFSLVLDCVLPCSVSRGAANRPTNQSGFSPNRGSNPVTLIVLMSVLPALALKTYCCLPLLSSPIFFCPIRRARRTPPWRDRVTFRSSTGPTPFAPSHFQQTPLDPRANVRPRTSDILAAFSISSNSASSSKTAGDLVYPQVWR